MTSAVTAPSVVSGTTPAAASSSSSSSSSSSTVGGLADNFQTFLTLLTTQLQNQNPLDPLDTNQFTQQLVQFAQVEQQLKSNDSLSSLVSLEKTTQSTQALNFVGKTAVVDGSTATLSSGTGGNATWSLNAPKDADATITITAANGQTAYSGNFSVTSGSHNFVWDGKGTDGTQWPAGNYTMSITAKDTSGASVAISTEVQGVIDSADLTADPPLLSIGGQSYTVSQIKRIVAS